MEEKKLTKKDYFEMLKEIVSESNLENKESLIYFITNQITSIDNKAAKAKERAAEKRAEGDALREAVRLALTDEYQSVDEITNKIGNEDVTKAKVIARLTQLVKLEEAVKTESKDEAGKSRMTYKLAD